MILEIVGYIGSFLVVLSMLMSSIVKLRVINTIGSVISGVYAVICGAYPLAFMNLCLIIINVFNLIKLLKTQKPYDLAEGSPEDSLVRYFLNYHGVDIKKYFPEFDRNTEESNAVFAIYCEGSPIGLLMGKREGETLDISVDYTVPAFRDCSAGKFLYERLPEKGIRSLSLSCKVHPDHEAYLARMGYSQENGVWKRAL